MGSLKGRRVQVAGDPLSPSATRLAPVVAAFAVGLLNALQSRMNGGLATAGILRVACVALPSGVRLRFCPIFCPFTLASRGSRWLNVVAIPLVPMTL